MSIAESAAVIATAVVITTIVMAATVMATAMVISAIVIALSARCEIVWKLYLNNSATLNSYTDVSKYFQIFLDRVDL